MGAPDGTPRGADEAGHSTRNQQLATSNFSIFGRIPTAIRNSAIPIELATPQHNCLNPETMHEGSISIRIEADVREIERLNRLVRQFGELHDVPSRTLYAVNLALDELVTNAVLYGFDDPAGQEVLVKIATAGSELIASVCDGGRQFNPLDVKPPDLSAPLEDRELGGLGVHLVRSLMDHVSYVREGNQNVLTVRKKIR
jgi:serine/threonine-protein kinase RsbW